MVRKRSPNPTLEEAYPNILYSLHPDDLPAARKTRLESKTLFRWKCKEHYRTESIPKYLRNSKCFICEPRQYLKETHPDLLDELQDQSLADTLTSGSRQVVTWICKLNTKHIWKAKIQDRSRKENGCPYCSGRMFLPELSLGALNPELAKQLHPSNAHLAYTLGPGSRQKVKWICEENHTWEARVDERKAGNKCVECLGRWTLKRYRQWLKDHQELWYKKNKKTQRIYFSAGFCGDYYSWNFPSPRSVPRTQQRFDTHAAHLIIFAYRVLCIKVEKSNIHNSTISFSRVLEPVR